MSLIRAIRALPLLGVLLLAMVTIIAVAIRFTLAELEPTESHTELVQLGRAVFLPPEWADVWRFCASVGLAGMLMMLVAPLLRYLPE